MALNGLSVRPELEPEPQRLNVVSPLLSGASLVLRQGNPIATLTLLRAAVALDPLDLTAHRRLVAVLANLGDLQAASDEHARYREVLRSRGDLSAVQNEVAYAAATLGELMRPRPLGESQKPSAPVHRSRSTRSPLGLLLLVWLVNGLLLLTSWAMVAPVPRNGDAAPTTPTPTSGSALSTVLFALTEVAAPTASAATTTQTPRPTAGVTNPELVLVAPSPTATGAPTAPATTSSVPATPSPAPIVTARPGPTPAPTAAPTQAPIATPAPTATPSTPPAPTATVAPTSAPLPSASPSSAPLPSCSGLQALINAAAVGTTVSVPACIYREQVVIAKSLTLQAQSGAEIRGSDVWTGWSGNVSSLSVPSFPTNGNCSQPRCAWPEQVFVDGVPQTQLAAGSSPSAGQFALDAARHVVLGSSPAGHLVEVTTRQYWLTVQASDVTVSGFRMQHAANPPQSGGLRQVSGDRVTFSNNVLSNTHGGVLLLSNGSFHRVLNNDVSRGGQEGIHGGGNDVLIQGNRIHDNNTEGFDCGWECGAFKVALVSRMTLDNNEVDHNLGPGLWCDIQCRDVVFSNNRVHHNANTGISFEISTGAKIFGNKVWENGWSFTTWGWGAGILVSSGGGAEIYNNIVAWNADGISIVSQTRSDAAPVTNNYVHDNVIVQAKQPGDASDAIALAWLGNSTMFDAAANNRGALNRYWNNDAEPTYCRFAWSACVSKVADFNATLGEEGGLYLTTTQRDALLTSEGIPTAPELD